MVVKGGLESSLICEELEHKPSSFDFNPPLCVDVLEISAGLKIRVVRDDALPGGTKQRAAVPYLLSQMTKGHSEFVYAGPFCGFAQVALACAGQIVGARVKLFCETVVSEFGTRHFHSLSALAEQQGASIVACDNLEEAEARAFAYCEHRPHCYKVPLGFDDQMFRNFLRDSLSIRLDDLTKSNRAPFTNLWIPVGSGTLAKVFRTVLQPEIQLSIVDVGVLPPSDYRIRSILEMPNTRYIKIQEEFHRKARIPPPISSNIFYDAKLWQVLLTKAVNGDVWWNVAA